MTATSLSHVQTTPLVLLGIGGVGRALIRQIVANRARHADDFGLSLDVRAVVDGGGAVIAQGRRGLDDDVLLTLESHKAAGRTLAMLPEGHSAGDPLALIADVDAQGLILVDCTASNATVAYLLDALTRGRDVVLANKLPLTVDLATWDAFAGRGSFQAANRGRARWETTVGAAVPIIATLRRLLAAGDDVARIEGTFSGSLNFLATELRAGKAFSAIVHDARARGYTEPDPRTDLGGVDMARKALILARMLGARIELADVAAEALYPEAMATMDVEAFMAATASLDAAFARTLAEAHTMAKAEGGVWRYAAQVTPHGASVGPVVVPADSPLGLLRGTDNHVAFHTMWYADSPLVLQGRGAGVDATASGVLSDIVELTTAPRG